MAEDLAREVTRIGTTLDDVCRRVEKIEVDYAGLSTRLAGVSQSNALIVQSQERIEKSLEGISKRVCKQEQKPADNWSKLIWIIGTVVVTAIMTLVIAKIGL